MYQRQGCEGITPQPKAHDVVSAEGGPQVQHRGLQMRWQNFLTAASQASFSYPDLVTSYDTRKYFYFLPDTPMNVSYYEKSL